MINLYLKGVFISSALYFYILSKIKGTTFIRTPEYLFPPIANELITPSSKLVVGNEHEYDDVNIYRFALDPDSTKHTRGTILTVISIGRTRL
ncbi:hypothetical protein N9192_01425 [Akkermansiaceae bacterium]|nr:hypothetical protein [Akkermansiaceae bacterium]